MLKDKIVVITGGSKGFGKALAIAFIAQGALVIIAAREENELVSTASEIVAFPIVCDVSIESGVINLLNQVINKYGKIDFWVNNAGVWLPHMPIEKTDWDRVHKMLEVNLFGTIYGSKAALIQMRKQNSGTILNVISTSALEGRVGSSGYCASKYAVDGFTESLRKEVQGTNIKVMSVYPGGMQTNIFDEGRPSDYDKFMPVDFVANKTIQNILQENPQEKLIIRRP